MTRRPRKPRVGRPRKPAAEKRSKAVTVRFSPGTYAAVERKAKAAEQPVADWVHDVAEAALTPAKRLDLTPEPCEAHGNPYCDCDK